MTIANKLNKLLETKQAIRQAIIDKGVEVADDTVFADYPSKIDSIPMEGGDPYYEEFYNLRTSNGTNMANMFARTSGELDLRKVDTSKVTNMQYMFDNSTASINIDGWDTSQVTNMSNMFNNFTGSIDASKLDTNNVTNAERMFNGANIDKIILTGLSFPKCTKLDYIFSGAKGDTLDLSSWDISNITSMSQMFAGAFTRINLSGWNTSHVTNMSSMFYKSNNPLEELIIPDWDMTNTTSSSSFMKDSYMNNLKLIDLSRSDDTTITKIASFLPTRTTTTYGRVLVPYDTSQEAYDALVAKYWAPTGAVIGPALTNTTISVVPNEVVIGDTRSINYNNSTPWNGDYVNTTECVLSNDTIVTVDSNNRVIIPLVVGETDLTIINKETKEVVSAAPVSLTVYPADYFDVKFKTTNNKNPGKFYLNNTIVEASLDFNTNEWIFKNKAPITQLSFSYSAGFAYVTEFIGLSLSKYVTTMSNMFKGCTSLTSLDVSNFNTSNVTYMNYMFYNCGSLTELDLSNFDTSNVTNMQSMFYGCESLTSLDVSNFDMTNVTNINSMFQSCSSLHTLRLDNCSNDTINKIINSSLFPTYKIEGVTRTIYCKESEAAGLTAPTNWVFSYIKEPCLNCGDIDCDGSCTCPYCGDPTCTFNNSDGPGRCLECDRSTNSRNSSCSTHIMHGQG